MHILPFWNGVPADKAVDQVMVHYNELRKAFPDKRILIAEVGWPSEGLTRVDKSGGFGGQGAVASPIEQGRFLRQFLVEAKKSGPRLQHHRGLRRAWKIKTEGGVGAYWGIWNADRELKPALQGTLVNYANWQWLAIATLALGLPFAIWMMRSELGLTRVGRFFVALLGCGSIMIGVWVYAQYSQLYLTWLDIVALVMIAPRDRAAVGHLPGRRPGDGGQSLARPDHAAPGAAAGAAPLEDAEGLGARALLQRAAGHDDRDHPGAGASPVPGLRGPDHRQQHQGRCRLEAGRGLYQLARPSELQILPPAEMAGLQGRRAQLRADPDPSRRRSDRHHRQRLYRARELALGSGAPFRRSDRGLGAGAAGLPRCRRRSLQAHVLLGICRLLLPRHEDSRREERPSSSTAPWR